jgi:WD40 repeat protein
VSSLRICYIVMTVLSNSAIKLERTAHDTRKLRVIFQFLESRGLMDTLAALEIETEQIWCPGSVVERSLDTLIDETAVLSPVVPPPVSRIAVTDLTSVTRNCHNSANPTCVSLAPDDRIITGGADSRLVIWSGEKKIEKEFQLPSPILSVDWSGRDQIVVGCMGGEVGWGTPESIQSITRPHKTHRIGICTFDPSGEIYATASNQDTCVILHTDGTEVARHLTTGPTVASVCWISDTKLVVAENGNCLMSLVCMQNQETKTVAQLCMNRYIDDPQSSPYTMLCLTYDRETKLLAGCTSRNSILLFDLSESDASVHTPTKTFYGMSIGVYDTPSICLSQDGTTIYVTNDNEVLLIDVSTGHKLYSIEISEDRAIRCMRRHMTRETIASVSFDKQLTILE